MVFLIFTLSLSWNLYFKSGTYLLLVSIHEKIWMTVSKKWRWDRWICQSKILFFIGAAVKFFQVLHLYRSVYSLYATCLPSLDLENYGKLSAYVAWFYLNVFYLLIFIITSVRYLMVYLHCLIFTTILLQQLRLRWEVSLEADTQYYRRLCFLSFLLLILYPQVTRDQSFVLLITSHLVSLKLVTLDTGGLTPFA